MDEETKDAIMQQLDMEIEAIIEEVLDSNILVKDGVEKACDAMYYFPGAAKLIVSGSIKIRVEFLSDDIAIETEEQTFNMPTDMDLVDKCRHVPDWGTLHTADEVGGRLELKCSKCGESGVLPAAPIDVRW